MTTPTDTDQAREIEADARAAEDAAAAALDQAAAAALAAVPAPPAPGAPLASLVDHLPPIERYAALAVALNQDRDLYAADLGTIENAIQHLMRPMMHLENLKRLHKVCAYVLGLGSTAKEMFEQHEKLGAEIRALAVERDDVAAARDAAIAERNQAQADERSARGRADEQYEARLAEHRAELERLQKQIADTKAELAKLLGTVQRAAS